jgi:hypothetical protein
LATKLVHDPGAAVASPAPGVERLHVFAKGIVLGGPSASGSTAPGVEPARAHAEMAA